MRLIRNAMRCTREALTGDTILAVVEEGDHAIGVHVLASVELKVLEVGNDLLGEGLSTLFEGLHTFRLVLLKVSLNGLHVALHVLR